MMLPQQVLLPQSKINVAAYARMICTHLVAQHTSAVCSIRTVAAVNAPVNTALKTQPTVLLLPSKFEFAAYACMIHPHHISHRSSAA